MSRPILPAIPRTSSLGHNCANGLFYSVGRHPLSGLEYCQYYCEECAQSFKYRPRFHRHDCHRGKRQPISGCEQFKLGYGGGGGGVSTVFVMCPI